MPPKKKKKKKKKQPVFLLKLISPLFTELPNEVILEKREFKELETEKFGKDYNLKDILKWGVLDFNRFKEPQLAQEIKKFTKQNTYTSIANKIQKLKEGRFLKSHNYPDLFIITPEYQLAFNDYLRKKIHSKKKSQNFQYVQKDHLQFFSKLMAKPQTRNLNINQKLLIIKGKFPQLKISRTTVHKMQHKELNFTWKRITQYRAKSLGRKLKLRIAFIKNFLEFLNSEKHEVFIIDEAGFGTKPLIHYAYSLKGTPVVFQKGKKLGKNLTCIATISTRCVEALQYLQIGGANTNVFEAYFDQVVNAMTKKYPTKALVFVLDNWGSHKTSYIMKIMQNEKRCFVLFTPSSSPELSPIENMFSLTKKLMAKKPTTSDAQLYAMEVAKIMFSLSEKQIQKFFRRTFDNILKFWQTMEIEKNKPWNKEAI